MRSIERVGLWITDIEVLRLHYAETLRHWRERFLANREQAKALYDERFCRMWEFYLAAAKSAFRYMGQVVFSRSNWQSTSVLLPSTRDYMVETERALAEMERRDSEQAA